MEPTKGEKSDKMYSPDDQGEYAPKLGAHNFSVQGLSDALMALESKVTMVQPPSEEYALLLEVTMADCPRCPYPPAFSWNTGMVMHILKGDPTLRDLENVQVDGPGMTYLFFDKQGHRGLKYDAAQALRRQRCFLSGFPTLPILLSFPSHWWRPGIGQWLLQKGTGKGPGQSTKTTLHTT